MFQAENSAPLLGQRRTQRMGSPRNVTILALEYLNLTLFYFFFLYTALLTQRDLILNNLHYFVVNQTLIF